MSRTLRAYLPGVPFHLTTRTSGHEDWFIESIRDAIVGIIATSLKRTDAHALVYAVMPNHLHLTVRQGDAPLSRLMQSVCRRVALLVHRTHKRKGHVFERQFRAKAIEDADHLRQVLYYTHRNPVKAKLCEEQDAYAWSSYMRFACATQSTPSSALAVPRLLPMLELFACELNSTVEEQLDGYRRFARWRKVCDSLPPGVRRPPGPIFPAGDRFYAQRFRPAPPAPDRSIPDLRDLVVDALRELAPDIGLETLIQRSRDRRLCNLRTLIIARAVVAGHRNVAIARFLNVAECTVSRIASEVYAAQSAAAHAPAE